MKKLGKVLVAWRHEQGLGIRAAAAVIGVSQATLCRIENGKPCDGKTLTTILFWLLEG